MPITDRSWPTGFPTTLDYPEVAVGSILAGAAHRFRDRVAFGHGTRHLTFSELDRAAHRFANALAAHGAGHGDVVAVAMPNCLAYPVAYFGTLLAGATFSPVNPLLPADDLAAQLADCGAVAAIASARAADAIAARLDRTRVELVVMSDPDGTPLPGHFEFAAFHAEAPDTAPGAEFDPHTTLAHLAYTGGTTGRSKGVCLPHRNVVVNALQFACCQTGSLPSKDERGDVVLDQVGSAEEWPVRLGTGTAINLTPWFHAMGTIGALNIPLLTGTTVVLHDRLDPGGYLAACERLRVTSIGGAPALFAALIADPSWPSRDLSSVRAITSGAAPLAHDVISTLARRCPDAVIAEGYGLTEVTMGAVSGPVFRSGLRKVGSVGVPLFDTEVKIADEHGDPVPAGERGEVCVRGPQVMTGYLNRPQETANALRDGWLHTGDVGVLDTDGMLSIVDRIKDMLIYKGYNVYPRELEELLIGRPEVRGAAVIGRPSAEFGELAVAFVVRAPGHDEITEAGLMAEVNEKLVPYKRLRELRFVDQIPVSAAGKILKRTLRDQL
ncbi:class I adenylate-forming enzyme family protein [Amycolatopsis minnesotensis]|uniref:AMP-binding protein n=1 Tax=Amycolatopsis minnesotensis TaxID=337894 RepID=A0ABN2SK15_9PSEU